MGASLDHSKTSRHASPALSKPEGQNLHCRQLCLLYFCFTYDAHLSSHSATQQLILTRVTC